MDTQANDKELIKEIEKLEVQVSELVKDKTGLIKEKKELLRDRIFIYYSVS